MATLFPLLDSNAVVDVQTVTSATQTPAGGTKENFVTTTSGVPVLMTLQSGGRDGSFGTDAERERGTIAGLDIALNSTRARLLVTAFPSRPEMIGKYLRVTSPVAHPPGLGGLVQARINVQYEMLNLPAVDV